MTDFLVAKSTAVVYAIGGSAKFYDRQISSTLAPEDPVWAHAKPCTLTWDLPRVAVTLRSHPQPTATRQLTRA